MVASHNRSSNKVSSESTASLHPNLRAALTSLDVTLVDELQRYRRHKAGYAPPPPRGLNTVPTGSPGLSPVATQRSSPNSSPTASRQPSHQKTIAANQHPDQRQVATPAATVVTASTVAQQSVSLGSLETTSGTSSPKAVSVTAPPTIPSDETSTGESSSSLLKTMPEPTATHEQDLSTQTATNQTGAIQLVASTQGTADSQGNDGSSTTSPTESGSLVPTGDADPFDYLASSEELLKSLSEDEPDFTTIREHPGLFRSLLTPLGIGSSLILLLSTATLTYVLLTNAMGRLSLNQSNGVSPDANSGPSSSTVAPGKPGITSSGLPDSPNLAAKEFIDLNLNTLSTLKTSSANSDKATASSSIASSPGNVQSTKGQPLTTLPSPVPLGSSTAMIIPLPSAVTPFVSTTNLPNNSGQANSGQAAFSPTASQVDGPSVSTRTQSPPARLPVPSPRASIPTASRFPTPTQHLLPSPTAITSPPPSQPAVRRSSPSPSSAITSPPPAAPTRPSSPGYTVVSPYTGDRHLENAQRVVPDAYVRNSEDGAKVQLGTFDDPAKARELVEQLHRQGIDAQIQLQP
ncbi:MAG: hypothetical protein RML75_02250 [Cyanobacteriota bacterium SKYGB_h_bin112]|nr:hypothetical protein [Cyanobacteriota bacterium SKYGB_h_bin112]